MMNYHNHQSHQYRQEDQLTHHNPQITLNIWNLNQRSAEYLR